MSRQSRFDARYWMLGAGALGWPRGMVWGGRREEGSGWGTHVYLWQIHFDIWQNQYNIVKLNKIKFKKINKIKLKNRDITLPTTTKKIGGIFSLNVVLVYTIKWIVKWISHTYTYIDSLLDFLRIQGTTMHLVEFPVLSGMFSLVICFFCAMLCLVAQSSLTLCDPVDLAYQAPLSMGILQESILEYVIMPSSRGIFPTQGLKPDLPHCSRFFTSWHTRKVLYVLPDQIRSVAQLCLTLCDPMNRSTPGFSVHHQLPEFTETHVHWVSDAINILSIVYVCC